MKVRELMKWLNHVDFRYPAISSLHNKASLLKSALLIQAKYSYQNVIPRTSRLVDVRISYSVVEFANASRGCHIARHWR